MPVPEGKLRRLEKKISQSALVFSHWLLAWFGQSLPRRLRFNIMYLGSPPWDTGVTPPELTAFINHHPPGRAIDLGCGTGTNLVALGQAGWQVTGVDFVERAVHEARLKLDRAGIPGDVRAGDVTRLEVVRGEYDLVLDIGCYHGLALQGREAYRINLGKILAPGGQFLIYTHWRSADQPDDMGLTDHDVNAFQKILQLEDRQDGQDRWGRRTAWMRFCTRAD